MSGGTDTSTTTNVADWQVPYMQNMQNFALQAANRPYTPYTGDRVADLNPYQTGAYDAMAQRAMQGSPVSDAAGRNITSTLNGDFLSQGNPYLTQQIDRASGDVLRNMDVLNARSGSFGNSGIQQNTVQQLGDVAGNMRYQDYNNERNRQMGALGMAPGIANQDYIDANQLLAAGQGYQNQNQRQLTDQYQQFTEARDYPSQQLATLRQGLMPSASSSTSMPGANNWAQLLGAGLAAYGGYNSANGGGSSGQGK